MNTVARYLLYIFSFFHFQLLRAQEEKNRIVDFNGYISDLQTVSFHSKPDSLIMDNLVHNRINFKATFSSNFYARVELRNRIFFGESVRSIPGYGKYISKDYGYENLTRNWLEEKVVIGTSTIDRLLLNYTWKQFQITAGRQRINWGVNTIWNPNDLFNVYNFLDFDYQERPGTDAIKIRYSLKSFSSIEFVYAPSKQKNQRVAAALLKFNRWKYDFQFLSGIYYDDIAIGAGWAGNISDAGFKGECTYFRNKNNFSTGDEDFVASIMFDYALKNSWYVSLSTLYSENPIRALTGFNTILPERQFVKSLMPYRWSFYAGVSKKFTPLFTGNFAIVYSPEKQSLIVFPILTYSIAENFNLDLFSQTFLSNDAFNRTPFHSITLRLKCNF